MKKALPTFRKDTSAWKKRTQTDGSGLISASSFTLLSISQDHKRVQVGRNVSPINFPRTFQRFHKLFHISKIGGQVWSNNGEFPTPHPRLCIRKYLKTSNPMTPNQTSGNDWGEKVWTSNFKADNTVNHFKMFYMFNLLKVASGASHYFWLVNQGSKATQQCSWRRSWSAIAMKKCADHIWLAWCWLGPISTDPVFMCCLARRLAVRSSFFRLQYWPTETLSTVWG